MGKAMTDEEKKQLLERAKREGVKILDTVLMQTWLQELRSDPVPFVFTQPSRLVRNSPAAFSPAPQAGHFKHECRCTRCGTLFPEYCIPTDAKADTKPGCAGGCTIQILT